MPADVASTRRFFCIKYYLLIMQPFWSMPSDWLWSWGFRPSLGHRPAQGSLYSFRLVFFALQASHCSTALLLCFFLVLPAKLEISKLEIEMGIYLGPLPCYIKGNAKKGVDRCGGGVCDMPAMVTSQLSLATLITSYPMSIHRLSSPRCPRCKGKARRQLARGDAFRYLS